MNEWVSELGEGVKVTPLVYLIIRGEGDSILFVQRHNRNFSLPARHFKPDETFVDTAVRGAKEELDLDIGREDLRLVHTSRFKDPDGIRLAFFVEAKSFGGVPINVDETQHIGIRWLTMDTLPFNTVTYVKGALLSMQSGQFRSEQGF